MFHLWDTFTDCACALDIVWPYFLLEFNSEYNSQRFLCTRVPRAQHLLSTKYVSPWGRCIFLCFGNQEEPKNQYWIKIIISSVRREDKTMCAQVIVEGLSCLLTANKNNRFIVLKNWSKDLATPIVYVVFSWKNLKLFMRSYTKMSDLNWCPTLYT